MQLVKNVGKKTANKKEKHMSSHISKKFNEALKEIKLEAGETPKAPSAAATEFGTIWKWVAILVFVIVVALIIVVLMRDTQAKNVVLEQIPPRKKRKRVTFQEEEEEEKNNDPNFTLLSDLMKQQQQTAPAPPGT